jgi:hypothetical protein
MKCVLSFPSTVLLTALLAATLVHAESLTWNFEIEQIGSPTDKSVELVVTAKLPPGWIVYSSDFTSDIGPQPTTFTFESSDGATPIGPVRAIGPKQKKDRTWDIELRYFENRAEFRQRFRLAREASVIRGTMKGQLCNEEEGTCTLFEEAISVPASIQPGGR